MKTHCKLYGLGSDFWLGLRRDVKSQCLESLSIIWGKYPHIPEPYPQLLSICKHKKRQQVELALPSGAERALLS